MKKAFVLISAMMALLFSMIFTGCNEDVINELTGPTDKWCYTTIEYGDNIKVDVYCYYATENKTITLGSNTDNSENKVELTTGLNLVIMDNENNTNANKILNTVTSGKTPFLFKSFAQGATMEIENDDGDTQSVSFKKTIWNIIYICNSWDNYTDKTFPLTKTYSNYESVSSLKDGFSLSKILKKIAANKLLEILEAEE